MIYSVGKSNPILVGNETWTNALKSGVLIEWNEINLEFQ